MTIDALFDLMAHMQSIKRSEVTTDLVGAVSFWRATMPPSSPGRRFTSRRADADDVSSA
ncbi:MAG TPA: hypothetical protein VMV19_09960 [Xanthobacteraceae bacterium]|nr:hypothetical protein [Xanthobacteraceae bacterium]